MINSSSIRRFGIVQGSAYTAKANGIEPYAYLKMLFTELPKAGTVEDVEALLPLVETNATRAVA